jgi:hypothetical protein
MFDIPINYSTETKPNSSIAPLLADVVCEHVEQKRSIRLRLESHARRHNFALGLRTTLAAAFAIVTRSKPTKSAAK